MKDTFKRYFEIFENTKNYNGESSIEGLKEVDISVVWVMLEGLGRGEETNKPWNIFGFFFSDTCNAYLNGIG